MTKFAIQWFDGKREPQSAPDPAYPMGRHLMLARPEQKRCTTMLPYPAARIGQYLVVCETCDYRAICTTAGRADDPRSVTIPCKGAHA